MKRKRRPSTGAKAPGWAVPAAPWSLPAEALLAALHSSSAGLSAREAARRLRQHGRNALQSESRAAWLRLLAHQFTSPLVLILVFAAAISLLLRDWIEAAIILAIVAGSALLGFAQEWRAASAVAALRRRLAPTAIVLREGKPHRVAAERLVPGDVVQLAAGSLVSADAVILEARELLVSEAALTGESMPVEKSAGVRAAEATLPARTNCVQLGSAVRSGVATALVVATGRDTAYGALAEHVAAGEANAAPTEFERGVRDFGALLLRVMAAMVVFVLIVNTVQGRPLVESLLFAVALAVGLSPELLPAIVSVTVARGARAMARSGVIVRRQETIENLGSIDILCTDKTGTLTLGAVVLAQALDAQGGAEGSASERVLRLAWLNATLHAGMAANALDAALLEAGRRADLDASSVTRVDEIPFDFQHRRLSIVLAEAGAAALIVTKGAFDNVLAVCTEIAVPGGRAPLDEAARAQLQERYRASGSEGFRVLALATRTAAPRERGAAFTAEDERGLCFEGLLLFQDPPKPGAARALRDLAALGISVKLITGDNRHVAAHVGEALGLDAAALLDGARIAALDDEALVHAAPRTALFAEIDPQQKERIVRALQSSGHAVGFLGDGINDAPALRAADVGISVDDAVDVAREAADIVLLRPDLDVLRRGVEDGRRTFANTLKYIGITTSANFGNMLSMALGSLFLPFLPLAAKQILLNNFLSDIPSIAISTDRVDAERIAAPQRWNVRELRRFMLAFGLVSTAFDLLTFVLLLWWFGAGEAVFQTAWFVISLLTELAVVLVLRTRAPMWASRPSTLLLAATIAVAALALALPYLAPMQALFGFVPLAPGLVAALVALLLGYLACTELTKRRIGAA